MARASSKTKGVKRTSPSRTKAKKALATAKYYNSQSALVWENQKESGSKIYQLEKKREGYYEKKQKAIYDGNAQLKMATQWANKAHIAFDGKEEEYMARADRYYAKYQQAYKKADEYAQKIKDCDEEIRIQKGLIDYAEPTRWNYAIKYRKANDRYQTASHKHSGKYNDRWNDYEWRN